MNRDQRLYVTLAGILGAGLVCTPVFAAPHAVLIGVGDYQTLDSDLPGIDLDIDMMQQVAEHLGIAPENTRVLRDADATRVKIRTAVVDWLPDRVAADDLVLIYFSGHGTRILDRNRDEDDGADEVLLPYDFFSRSNPPPGESSLGNVIVDDELSQWLAAIPSRNVLVFIDACHSGTATRSFDLENRSVAREGVVKFYEYPGMPPGAGDLMEKASPSDTADANYAAVTATQDNQYAITTISGSYFTLGLHKAIADSVADGTALSPATLRDKVAAYIETRLEPERVFVPSVAGNAELLARDLPIQRVTEGHGPRWRQYESFVAAVEPLSIRASGERYTLGDELSLSIDVPKDGYLNVISIDATDKTTVLYPNQYHASNLVTKGTFEIPTAEMPFEIVAAEPVGPTLVLAFVTQEAIHAYTLGLDGRDELGVMSTVFTEASPQATRAFAVVSVGAAEGSGPPEPAAEPPEPASEPPPEPAPAPAPPPPAQPRSSNYGGMIELMVTE